MDEQMNESDSDDDLVAPDFLIKKVPVKLCPVLSPRRAICPINETLLPLPVLEDEKRSERSCKARISLSSLLTEKKKEDVIQQNAYDIMELKEKFQNEDYMDLVNNDFDNSQNCSQISLSQDFEDSQDLSQQFHSSNEQDQDAGKAGQEENKENIFSLSKHLVNDFPDTFPGEKYFVNYRPTEKLMQVTKDLYVFVMECDESVVDENINGEDQNELLHTILQCFVSLQGKYPSQISECLWEVLCFSQDYKLSQIALQILTDYLLTTDPSPEWVPDVDDVIVALKKFGGDFSVLLPDSIAKLMEKHIPPDMVDVFESPLSPKSIRKCFNSRLHNFCSVIRLITVAIQCHAMKYSIEDLNCFLIIAMRLTIERVLQGMLCFIKVLIGSLLDAHQPAIWIDQLKNKWLFISFFQMHHRNLLHMIETIPPSKRGTELQQMLAFNTASSIIWKDDEFYAPPVKINDIFHLISSIRITDETNYFELYSALSLIGLCINTDDVTAAQKTNLMMVRDKLQMLHGEIRECKGAYLDRTKVKDVILRMVSKFKFVVQSLQSQSKLESYFGTTYKPTPLRSLSSDNSEELMEDESPNSDVKDDR